MFYGYLVLDVNNEEVLYLYLNNYEEFSNEFNNYLKKENLYDKNVNYIKQHKINFNGKKVMFVVNGLIIGSLVLASSSFANIDSNVKPYPFLTMGKNYIIENSNGISTKNTEFKDHKILIKINNSMKKIKLNEYLLSIISTKVLPSYNIEAIKTIVVLTRTDIFKELYEKKYIDSKNIIYPNKDYLKNIWGNHFLIYYNKIKKAIIQTDNEYIIFRNYFLSSTPAIINDTYKIGITNYGINLLSKAGYDYKQILSHYYPNSKIMKL